MISVKPGLILIKIFGLPCNEMGAIFDFGLSTIKKL